MTVESTASSARVWTRKDIDPHQPTCFSTGAAANGLDPDPAVWESGLSYARDRRSIAPVGLTIERISAETLNALTEAAAAIDSTQDLDSVLHTIARQSCEAMRAEACNLFTLGQGDDKFRVSAAFGPRRGALVGQQFGTRIGVAGEVLRSGSTLRDCNVSARSFFSREYDDVANQKTRCIIAAPLLHRSEVIGVVELVNRRDGGDFGDGDVSLLKLFSTLFTAALRSVSAREDLQRRLESLRSTVSRSSPIIGNSEKLQELLTLCERAAPSDATVLILGETGTGKELVARHVHSGSRRRNETFLAVNCAALPETLLESELFGHEKGAFTSAHQQRHGLFELADGGTLFLDEIGEISRSTQAKLLRVLQEREFVRVGGTKTIRSNVRIVAATNRNLKNMMHDGLFREDLYYRLSVFPVRVPPLRERREDVPALAEHFVARASKSFHIPKTEIAPDAMRLLSCYDWPGNVRELENVVERSVLMVDGSVLRPNHLPPDIQAAADDESDDNDEGTLYGHEKQVIQSALERNNWNQSQTARTLGITRDYLRHRIKKYSLQRPTVS